VPRLNIPPRNREGISKLLSLDAVLFDQFVTALEAQTAGVKLISQLSSSISLPNINQEDLEKILSAVSALYLVRSSTDVSLESFVADVSEALQPFDAAAKSDRSRDRLRRALSVNALDTSAKAITLLTDHERTLHAAKILTDIRYAFQSDPSLDPYGAVIVHVLKLTYHEEDRHKDFYVAMDGADVANLKAILDRAEAKANTLRQKLQSAGITYLGGADKDGGSG